MALDIDINFNFTKDCKYWESYHSGYSDCDPDIYSPTLRLYQKILYSRTTPSGKKLNLELGQDPNYDYLVCDGIRYSSDHIINMFERYDIGWPKEKEIVNYESKLKDCILKAYTIGGEIIFPKRQNSINQERGKNRQIKDRFDLTLECIRRFYKGEDSCLYDVLKADEEFFKMFVNFKGYVDFFFLKDLVSWNYKKVRFFLGNSKDVFNSKGPAPEDEKQWERLLKRQLKFVERRNKRIKKFCHKFKDVK